MYNINESVNRIKNLAKVKEVTVNQMLKEIGVNKNAIFSLTTRGSWGNAETIFKIADYFDCSVDYLLCRTDNPEINHQPAVTVSDSDNATVNSPGAVVGSYNGGGSSFADSLVDEVFSHFKNLEISDRLEILSEIIRRENK